MKKQLKLLFFVAMLAILVVMTMAFVSAADPVDDQGENAYQVIVGGATKYTATLADAVAAADSDSTITVLTPVGAGTDTVTATVTGKTLTIDGGNKLIGLKDGLAWIVVGDNATVTMTNMNVEYIGGAANDMSQAIIAVNGTDALLTISGKNTFYISANGNAAGAKYTGTSKEILVDAIKGTARVWGGNTEDTRVVVYMVGHCAATFRANGGFMHVKNTLVTNEYEGLEPSQASGFLVAETSEVLAEDSTFIMRATATSRTVSAKGTGVVNLVNCEVTGYRALEVNTAGGTINVMGGTYRGTHTKTTSEGATIYFNKKGTVNVYDGTFLSAGIVIFYGGADGSVVNVYGGTFHAETGNVVVYYKIGTLNIADADPEETTPLTVASAGGNLTRYAQGAELRVSTGYMFLCGNKNPTVKLGNGTMIYVEGKSSFDSRFTGCTNYTVGTIDYYCIGGMDDNDAAVALDESVAEDKKIINGTKLPAIWMDAWNNTTFHYTPVITVSGVVDTLDKTGLEALAVQLDTTKADWSATSLATFVRNEGETPSFILNGTILTLTGDAEDVYENCSTLFTVNAGSTLNIQGGVYKAAAAAGKYSSIIEVNGGTLNITGATTQFIAEDWSTASRYSYGLIYALDNSTVTIDCGTTAGDPVLDAMASNNVFANFIVGKNGNLVGLEGDGIDVTVKNGVFLRKTGALIPGKTGEDSAYSTGAVFYLAGEFSADSTSKLTIEGGCFYANIMVRIYAVAQETETVEEVTTVIGPCKGWDVTIKGGTFVSNAVAETNGKANYAFHIHNAGEHTITFTADTTAKVYANANSKALFYVNTETGLGDQDYGCAIEILGGEFNIVKSFYSSTNTLGNISLTIKDAVITQSAASDATVIALANTTTGFDASSITLENAQIYAGASAILIKAIGNVTVSIDGGIYAAGSLMQAVVLEGVEAKITSFDVKGGTIILMGDNENWYFYDVEVAEGFDPIIAAKANTVIKEGVALSSTCPIVMYGTLELKVWMSFVADEGNVPTIEAGAGLYLGENGSGADPDDCGMRFKSSVPASVIENGFMVPDSENEGQFFTYTVLAVGHLIAPADYVAAAGAFTVDALQALSDATGKTTYITVNAYDTYSNDGEGYWNLLGDNEDEPTSYSFAVALVSLNSTKRSYAAVPYVLAEVDGTPTYFYGAFNTVDNARSAQQIGLSLN